MGGLSTALKESKKLSIKDVKVTYSNAEFRFKRPTPAKAIDKPLNAKEKAYNKLKAINPVLQDLVDTFDLVNDEIRESVLNSSTETTGTPQQPTNIKPNTHKADKADKPSKALKTAKPSIKLENLVKEILQDYESYSSDEVIERIAQATNVDKERAERGFIMMLEAGLIEHSEINDKHHLKGSTPF